MSECRYHVVARTETCFTDSCLVLVEEICLPSGMVKLVARDYKANIVQPVGGEWELQWSIWDGPNGKNYSVRNQSEVVVSQHTRYCLRQKRYFYRPGRPKLPHYAEICTHDVCDSVRISCNGPCEDFAFILSSCHDDYDVLYDLNFPDKLCRTVCENGCDFIVGLFDLNGELIDENAYEIMCGTTVVMDPG